MLDTKHEPLAAGMTLRDHFAAVSLQGLLAGEIYQTNATIPEIAATAYEFADAMMTARKEAANA